MKKPIRKPAMPGQSEGAGKEGRPTTHGKKLGALILGAVALFFAVIAYVHFAYAARRTDFH